jgi:hypothetical protein
MMRRRQRTTTLATAVNIFLTLSVQVENDGQKALMTRHLVSVTRLAIWLWTAMTWLGMGLELWRKAGAVLSDWDAAISRRLNNLQRQIVVWWTVTGIGFKSVLYGVGVAV